MKIVCVGSAFYDVTFVLDDFIKENTKTIIKNRIECGGGSASNAAYLLGKWNMDTTFIGVAGNDGYGNYIKKELDSVNVNTTNLELNDKYNTVTSFILANLKNGSRTVLTHKLSELKKEKIHLDFEPDVILTDGREFEISEYLIKKHPNAISIIDAEKTDNKTIELCKKVNYLVCSKDFAETLTEMYFNFNDPVSIEKNYLSLKEMFHNNIVITLEDKGCLYEYNNQIKMMPSIKVKPIDTTGAGDIFHGAFTYGIANNFDYEEIITIANIAAGLSVTKIGGRNSVFDLDRIRKYYNEFK